MLLNIKANEENVILEAAEIIRQRRIEERAAALARQMVAAGHPNERIARAEALVKIAMEETDVSLN